jgi:hypothetical protein
MPDTWSELCAVNLALKGKNDFKYAALVEDVEFEQFSKPVTFAALINGGRAALFEPHEEVVLRLGAWPVEAGTDSDLAPASYAKGFFDLLYPNSSPTVQPLSYPADRLRKEVRALIMWTDDPAIIGATGSFNAASATASLQSAKRIQLKGGFVRSITPTFADKRQKEEIEIVFPPFAKNGTSNITVESTDATAAAVLSSVDTYT